MQIFPSLKHSFNLVCAAKMNETTFVGRRLFLKIQGHFRIEMMIVN